jgi:hypothetical protein
MGILSGIPALLLGISGMVLGSVPLVGDGVLGSMVGVFGTTGPLLMIELWFLWTIFALILGTVGGIIGSAISV